MDKVISLGYGIRRQPSIGTEGELSELVNLVPKNGELVNVKPMTKEEDMPTIGAAFKLLATHDVGDSVHYIVLGASVLDRTTILYYYPTDSGWRSASLGTIPTTDENVTANTVGYTITLSWDGGKYYYIWKDGSYVALGDSIPELSLSFGLQGKCVRTEKTDYRPPKGLLYFGEDYSSNFSDHYAEFFEDDQEEINTYFHGEIGKFINEESRKKGRFMYPFFVRYAYRLYDGSLTMHSAPILMVCSTRCAPVCTMEELINPNDEQTAASGVRYHIMGVTHDLDYMPINIPDSLSNWKDIVRSVDIFISSPIYTYDQEGDIDRIINDDANYGKECYAICKHVNYDDKIDETKYPKMYQKKGFDVIESMSFYPDFTRNIRFIKFPEKGINDIETLVKETSLFYHIDSIPLDKISSVTERTKISLKKDVLLNLETREVMSDDYGSHDTITGKGSFVYNNRLALSNITKKPYAGYRSDICFGHTDGYVSFIAGGQGVEPTDSNYTSSVQYIVKIKEEGAIRTVGGSITTGQVGNHLYNPLLYFYYPNPNAYEAIFYADNGGLRGYYKIALTPHTLLNGAYYFAGFTGEGICSDKNEQTVSVTMNPSDDPILLKNYVYVTESSNPFVVGAANITQVGTGEIIKLSTSAKALSQGQFGQFPLYAFCTDGIWALEVASDGSYSAKQPISRDVCNNPNSITQIDGAVVFTTDQGLKMIQGSEVVLLSSNMDGHNVDESNYFPTRFFEGKGYSAYDGMVVQTVDDFRTILETCSIAYDYPNGMLRIFPQSGNKYYVYDLGTREFGSVIYEGPIKTIVHGYPTSIVQIKDSLYTFASKSDSTTLRKGLLLTRPIDMGEPFALKKLQDMRLYYTKYNQGSMCKAVLYVSNDGIKWAEVKSLRGGSYKYFRIALITEMTDDDRLSGIALRYELNRSNKLR